MIEITSVNEENFASLEKFCHECAANVEEPAAANMKDLPALIRERFQSNGIFQIILDDGEIIGCGGAYVSDFSPHIALLGCRAWLKKEYRSRSLVRDLLLPVQRTWAIEQSMKQIALSFNDYNKNLVHLFTRNLMRRVERTSEMMFFKNKNVVDHPVMIKNTPQWVIFEKLEDWDFDWSTIRAAQDS